MPALITHDFFGRDVYDRLYTFIGGSRDEADAFLLGNPRPRPSVLPGAQSAVARAQPTGLDYAQ